MMINHKRDDVKSPNEPDAKAAPPGPQPGDLQSINEPPGSDVSPPPELRDDRKDRSSVEQARDVSHETSELPSDAELERMTRAELDNLAEERGVDISRAHNKDDVIAALHKDARKRHR